MMDISDTAIVATFSALAVATSSVLIFLPNIETITYTIFLSGFLLGKRLGALTGLTTAISWEIIATLLMGGFSGIIFPFKVIFWIMTGIAGSVVADLVKPKHSLEFSIIGASLGLLYDLWVTIGVAFLFLSSNAFFPVFLSRFILGIPFTISHVVGNFAIFSTMPYVIRAIKISENPLEEPDAYLRQKYSIQSFDTLSTDSTNTHFQD